MPPLRPAQPLRRDVAFVTAGKRQGELSVNIATSAKNPYRNDYEKISQLTPMA
jgi:hypothetical protein